MNLRLVGLFGFFSGYALTLFAFLMLSPTTSASGDPVGLFQPWRLPWSDGDREWRAGGCAVFETAGVCNHTTWILDISSMTDDPIHSFRRGVVTYTPNSGNCGNTVAVQHQNPGAERSVFCHLSTFSNIRILSPNNYVNQGEYLGIVGNSGNTTGPHLHFSMRNSAGTLINFSFGGNLDLQHLSNESTSPGHQSDNMGVGYSSGRDTTIDSGAISNAVASAFFSFGLEYGSTYANSAGGACNISTRRYMSCSGIGTQNFVAPFMGASLPSSATRGPGSTAVHRIAGRFWKTYDRTITVAGRCPNQQVYVCLGRPTSGENPNPNGFTTQVFENGQIVRFDDGSGALWVMDSNGALIQQFIISNAFV